MAADPTFPLLSIFAFLSALLLLILLVTNVVRHSWNLGVTFLSFWLLWENLLLAVNAIIWSDNADIKLDIFCDITSHVYMFTYVVKPACTLVLTRRLYKIASMQSLIPESRKARIVDAAIEWFLGLGLPTLVTGVFYYIVQGARFQVIEGFGCENTENIDGIEILLIEAPVLILPLISLLFYCPKIIYVFFRFGRDMNHFLQTNGSISRSGYSRILILGCLDILLTLPFGTLLLVSRIRGVLKQFSLPFYFGWDATHSNWDPISLSWSVVEMSGNWAIFNIYFTRWSSVILALTIFALFGLTAESRATYSRGMLAVFKLFGWTLPERKHDDIGSLKFGVRSLVASGQTRTQRSTFATFPEMGEAAGEDAERGIQPSIISDSSEGKITSPAIWPRLPDIGTALTLQAEDRQVRGNSERSNMKGGGIHVDRGGDEKANVDIDGPHFVGIHESLRVMQPAHSDPPVEAAGIV